MYPGFFFSPPALSGVSLYKLLKGPSHVNDGADWSQENAVGTLFVMHSGLVLRFESRYCACLAQATRALQVLASTRCPGGADEEINLARTTQAAEATLVY